MAQKNFEFGSPVYRLAPAPLTFAGNELTAKAESQEPPALPPEIPQENLEFPAVEDDTGESDEPLELLPFQSSFVAEICKESPPEIAVLSLPRGNGKSWLCGGLVARSVTPGDALFVRGVENILVSSSTAQAKIVLEFARQALGEVEGYRWRREGVTHLESRARVRIISSDSKRALGLGAHVRLIICDEPAAWSNTAGARLWDAIITSLGKRRLTVIAVGTLAPAPLNGPGAWWPEFVAEGSGDGRHVVLLQGDPKKWWDFAEVLRVNPVAAVNPYLMRALEREHRAALKNDRAARTFKMYRLNIPGEPVDAQPLITAAEWERVCARPVPECEGKPVIGVDLGGNRSWSAAAALWPNGRIEAWALAPGTPSLADQEKADQVPDDSYLELVKSGGLSVDVGLAVPTAERLLSRIWAWQPYCIVSDPYRSADLHSAIAGRVRLVDRARGGAESTSNLQALRSLLLDSTAGVTEASRVLLGAAWEQTNMVIDNAGITKLGKVDQRRSRDDAAAALLLAAGEQSRRPKPVQSLGAVISQDGKVTWF